MSENRDLTKDLEICNRATPGPWLPGHLPDIEQDCEICKINAFYNKNVNREFIAQAREGWPHAIERAIKAEAEVERLQIENARYNRESDAKTMALLEICKQHGHPLMDANYLIVNALELLDKEGER